MPAPSNPVDVLLALLEHSNVDTMMVLMKPENVLTLLRQDGWSDEDVRKALAVENKIPGQLVLELIQRGHTADELLASLGPAAVAEVAAERAKTLAEAAAKRAAAAGAKSKAAPAATDSAAAATGDAPAEVAPATPLARMGVGSGRAQIAGLVVVMATALAPAMLALFDLKIALALLGFGIAPVLGLIALGGAVGGALAADSSARRWLVAFSGGVAATGGFAAVIGYALWTASLGRTSLLRLEVAATCLIGMIPGMLLAALSRKKSRV